MDHRRRRLTTESVSERMVPAPLPEMTLPPRKLPMALTAFALPLMLPPFTLLLTLPLSVPPLDGNLRAGSTGGMVVVSTMLP